MAPSHMALRHRQHHVSKAYLRGWATNERIWVLQAERVRQAHLKDVAVQRHFYKLEALTPTEIQFIRAWIAKSPPRARRSHEGFLAMFTLPAILRAQISDADAAANPELVAHLDQGIVNLQEEYHGGLESWAVPHLEALRRGDVAFFTDDTHAMKFAYFLAVQHFRTSAIKERIVVRLQERMNFDMSRCWPVLSHIFASNVGFSLFAERKRSPLRLLAN